MKLSFLKRKVDDFFRSLHLKMKNEESEIKNEYNKIKKDKLAQISRSNENLNGISNEITSMISVISNLEATLKSENKKTTDQISKKSHFFKSWKKLNRR